ncbi:hypothetical protein J2Z65_006757 [Paenibacillus aceris]|uniref:Uncharacterized protein n=1 Tax=Paenibacillus aceris TaxID=869555 RepID=A0ABS4I9E2_9BACL|nr:hypothetical protein [Paenibacillus aceris]
MKADMKKNVLLNRYHFLMWAKTGDILYLKLIGNMISQ